jgi:hypothetical protein
MPAAGLRPPTPGCSLMDMITESLLDQFSKEQELTLPKDQRFEHFAAYITVRRQHGETFDTDDVVTGKGGDTGIDGFAALVNGNLVTTVDDLDEIAESAAYLDVVFVFVQAVQTSSFDGMKIGNFGYGVLDFFSYAPKLKRNDKIDDAAVLMRAIYKRAAKFKRGNPACKLYYVTTGKWEDDANLVARKDTVIADLAATNLFSAVDFYPVGATGIQKLYAQAKNAIARDFTFQNRTVVPVIAGVKDAYLGLIPATEALKILTDDDGEIIKSIFYDNVRDWQDFNAVNDEIRKTLKSADASRFVLMNNGITIIARHLQPTGNTFHIEDFQIVNGCQTSHVLFEVAREQTINDAVMIPLRLISTQDEEVTNAIIRATNRQTEVKAEQFFAITEFPRRLEAFFKAFPSEAKRLYYERRSRQYDSLSIEKTRIVTQANLTRAFAAIFLSDPHSVTRSYKLIRAKIGDEIFGANHKLDPYYVAAYALYKLEYLFRNHKLDARYKPARYHILFAVRLLINPAPLAPMNSNSIEKYSESLEAVLWDGAKADEVFSNAVAAIDQASGGTLNRDAIRTVAFTAEVMKACGVTKPGSPAHKVEGNPLE